jgi:hypothetical protein
MKYEGSHGHYDKSFVGPETQLRSFRFAVPRTPPTTQLLPTSKVLRETCASGGGPLPPRLLSAPPNWLDIGTAVYGAWSMELLLRFCFTRSQCLHQHHGASGRSSSWSVLSTAAANVTRWGVA